MKTNLATKYSNSKKDLELSVSFSLGHFGCAIRLEAYASFILLILNFLFGFVLCILFVITYFLCMQAKNDRKAEMNYRFPDVKIIKVVPDITKKKSLKMQLTNPLEVNLTLRILHNKSTISARNL